jgi:hypothetical protein
MRDPIATHSANARVQRIDVLDDREIRSPPIRDPAYRRTSILAAASFPFRR